MVYSTDLSCFVSRRAVRFPRWKLLFHLTSLPQALHHSPAGSSMKWRSDPFCPCTITCKSSANVHTPYGSRPPYIPAYRRKGRYAYQTGLIWYFRWLSSVRKPVITRSITVPHTRGLCSSVERIHRGQTSWRWRYAHIVKKLHVGSSRTSFKRATPKLVESAAKLAN
jgi:hypothetical protein